MSSGAEKGCSKASSEARKQPHEVQGRLDPNPNKAPRVQRCARLPTFWQPRRFPRTPVCADRGAWYPPVLLRWPHKGA